MRKKTHTFREMAKFLSGLILADLLGLVWFYFGDLLPMSFAGIEFTNELAAVGIVFDVVILFLLIYYGWHQHKNSKKQKEHWFHYVAGVLFVIVALVHLVRVLFGWSFTIGDWAVPYWLNTIAALITAYLGVASFYLAKE